MAPLAHNRISACPRPLRRQQAALWCRVCGAETRLIGGYCAACYAQRRWDRAYFGGQRAGVLARDNYQCQVCGHVGAGKRSLAVHHRRPGISKSRFLITLCLACHARLHRTHVLKHRPASDLSHAVLLWREQHPGAPEQLALAFDKFPTAPVAYMKRELAFG